ncbi:MAG TPA: murein biosynthesis integral membrane protein MurJ [Clostridiales bacterium]|nr:murein biosynthesis integral membrane protein MurJ [Clostridiales bacterium]
MGIEKKNNMTGNALMIMVSVVLSRILGFVRTMLIPERLGGMNVVTDAYNLAFLLPDLMYSLLVGGAIAAALIPMLAGYIEKDDEKEGWKAVGTFINVTFIAMVFVSILGIIFAPQLMNLIAPGYKESNKEVFDLSVQLTRILFPSVCFLMLAGLCNGIMNSYQKFVVAAYGPCLYNLLCILSIYFLSNENPDTNYGVIRVVWGVVLSSLFYFLFQVLFTMKHLKFYRPTLYFKHKGFHQMMKLAIPSLMTTSVMQVNIIISNSVSTNFAEGSVTALSLANKTWQMPLGIIAQSMGVAMLPILSALYAATKHDEFIQKFNKALRTVLMLSVPSAFGLAILANPVIRTLFKFSDKLTEADINLTARILAVYAIALVAQSINTIMNRSFFSVKDAITPLISGIVAIIVNISSAILIYKYTNLGVRGIALAYSLAACVNMVILAGSMHKKMNILRNKKQMAIESLKMILSSVVMSIVLLVSEKYLLPMAIDIQIYYDSKIIQVIVLLFQAALGIVSYFLCMVLLRSKDIWDVTERIIKRKQKKYDKERQKNTEL